jgi:hypothetical protein
MSIHTPLLSIHHPTVVDSHPIDVDSHSVVVISHPIVDARVFAHRISVAVLGYKNKMGDNYKIKMNHNNLFKNN